MTSANPNNDFEVFGLPPLLVKKELRVWEITLLSTEWAMKLFAALLFWQDCSSLRNTGGMWQSQSGTCHQNVVTVQGWSELGFIKYRKFSFFWPFFWVCSCLDSSRGGDTLYSSSCLSGFCSFTHSRGHTYFYNFHMHNTPWMLYSTDSFLPLLHFLLCFPSLSRFYGPISSFHRVFSLIPAHRFLSLFFALVITMCIHSFAQWAWDLFEDIKCCSLTILWSLLCLEWCFRPGTGMMKHIKQEF